MGKHLPVPTAAPAGDQGKPQGHEIHKVNKNNIHIIKLTLKPQPTKVGQNMHTIFE